MYSFLRRELIVQPFVAIPRENDQCHMTHITTAARKQPRQPDSSVPLAGSRRTTPRITMASSATARVRACTRWSSRSIHADSISHFYSRNAAGLHTLRTTATATGILLVQRRSRPLSLRPSPRPDRSSGLVLQQLLPPPPPPRGFASMASATSFFEFKAKDSTLCFLLSFHHLMIISNNSPTQP